MVDNEFGITDPFYMTREELVRKNAHVFDTQYMHPGYLTQSSINTIKAEHNKVVSQLETEIEMLRAQVKELHNRIEQMEINNSPVILI
jgi:cell division protein FtsB